MQKFVITNEGEMRFGDVRLHRHLLPWGDDECHGGGFWELNPAAKTVELYGRSYDFGAPDFSAVRSIDWSGLPLDALGLEPGEKPALIYYPLYPLLENPERVIV